MFVKKKDELIRILQFCNFQKEKAGVNIAEAFHIVTVVFVLHCVSNVDTGLPRRSVFVIAGHIQAGDLRDRKTKIKDLRQMAMELCCRYSNCNQKEIGAIFGADYSTGSQSRRPLKTKIKSSRNRKTPLRLRSGSLYLFTYWLQSSKSASNRNLLKSNQIVY